MSVEWATRRTCSSRVSAAPNTSLRPALSTSIKQIAARADVTKGSLYHHFADKKDALAGAAVSPAVREALAVAINGAIGAAARQVSGNPSSRSSAMLALSRLAAGIRTSTP